MVKSLKEIVQLKLMDLGSSEPFYSNIFSVLFRFQFTLWKFPGGLSDLGENIGMFFLFLQKPFALKVTLACRS